MNVKRISFLISRKTILDGLLGLGLRQEAPYHAMAMIISVHGSGYLYIEHTNGEFTQECEARPLVSACSM